MCQSSFYASCHQTLITDFFSIRLLFLGSSHRIAPNLFVGFMSKGADSASESSATQRDRLPNLLSSISLGLGVMGVSAPFLQHLELTPTVTFLTRLLLSSGSASALFVFDQRAVQTFSGRSLYQLFQDGEPAEFVYKAFYKTVNSVATFGFIPFLGSLALDEYQNREVTNHLETIHGELQSYLDEPGSIPGVLEIEAALLEEVARDLDEEGNMTPQSAAKLALYFDGQKLEEDSTAFTLASCQKFWPLSGDESEEICYRNPDNWMIVAGEHSWWLGPEAQGPNVQDFLQNQFANTPQAVAVRNSGLIDGRSFEDDLLAKTGPLPLMTQIPLVLEYEAFARNNLGLLTPQERNREIRDILVQKSEALETQALSDTAILLDQSKKSLLNAGDPHSYGGVLSLVQH